MRCELDTKDGGVCLTTLRNNECPNWVNHAYGTSWSHDSAIWQVTHGEPGTPKTDNAFEYLMHRADAVGISEYADESLVKSLVEAIRTLRPKADKPVDYGAPCPHTDNEGKAISCSQAERAKMCKCGHPSWEHLGLDNEGTCSHLVLDGESHRFCTCLKFEAKEENRTKHKLYTAALQVKTYEHKYAGSKQVPRMWVEASSAAEAQRIMSDIVNTAVRCSYVSMVSPVIQEVEATLIWADKEN